MKKLTYRGGCWHALPNEAAVWWRDRLYENPLRSQDGPATLSASMLGDELLISR